METTTSTATKPVTELTIPEILEAFRTIDGTYKRAEIDAAIRLKAEITPHLIKILEDLLADPERYIIQEDLCDHIYAVMLLGHFREPKAHRVIIDLFSLSDDVPNMLFGDICTSDLAMILLNTCGGDVSSIQSMILNREADDYCRVSACEAMAYAVLEGFIAREAVIGFFHSLFTDGMAEEDSDFWSLLAMIILDLHPGESMDVIQRAYDEEWIFPGMVEFEDFEKALSFEKDACLEKLKQDFLTRSLDDIHARMSWLSMFRAELEYTPSLFDSEFGGVPHSAGKYPDKSQKAQKKIKKKKRKQAKASKKKNRR